MRDPFQSILAEFNRQSGGHIGHAPSTKYRKDDGRCKFFLQSHSIREQQPPYRVLLFPPSDWNHFARFQSLCWMNTTLDWLMFQGPVHLVFYEDLLDNLPEEMRRILEFLDITIEEKDFACMLRYKDGIYKRRKRTLPFDPFSDSLKKWIEKCRAIVDKAIREFMAGSDMNSVLPKLYASYDFNSNYTKRPKLINN